MEGLELELSDHEEEKLGVVQPKRRSLRRILRGRDHFARFIFRTVSNEDCEAAMQNFKTAIELDPHFALAYSGLGACYANRVFKGLADAEEYTYAEPPSQGFFL